MDGDGRVCRYPPWSPWTECSLRRDANTTLLRTRVAFHVLSTRDSPPRRRLARRAPTTVRPCTASTSCATRRLSTVNRRLHDYEPPSDCRSSRAALRPCAFLTSTFCDERARLTCRCSSARRVSHKKSFGASCLSCLDTTIRLAPSARVCSSRRASSTSCSSGRSGRYRPPSGGGYRIAARAPMVLQRFGWSAWVLERAVLRRSRLPVVAAVLGRCVSASTDLRGPRGSLSRCAWTRGGDGMRPVAQGSDARMCGGRLMSVGTCVWPPLDVRAVRAASGRCCAQRWANERVFGVCVHAVDLYKSSPGQGSLAHAHTQRGQSLSHGLRP